MLRVRSLACLLSVTLALSGCPSLTERTGLPPSVDRAAQLESSGDNAGAARVYEELAAHNSGSDHNDFLLHAAEDYVRAHRPEDAARVLTLTEGTLSAEQGTERALLNVRLALERNQREEALRQFAAISAPHGGAWRRATGSSRRSSPSPPARATHQRPLRAHRRLARRRRTSRCCCPSPAARRARRRACAMAS